MKRIIFNVLAMCCLACFVQAQEPVCPPAATSSSTVFFARNMPIILPGAFSVRAGKQVNFTKGNLQYNAAYNSWRFAAQQYTVLRDTAISGGNNTVAGRATQDKWIDLFGWCTSGYNNLPGDPRAVHFQPWDGSHAGSGDPLNNYGYGPSTSILGAEENLSSSTRNYDWGVYNFTSGTEAGCRVLTQAEWAFVVTGRDNAGLLGGMGTLLGITGYYLLPDNWIENDMWNSDAISAAMVATGFEWTNNSQSFSNNTIADDANGVALWRAMEEAGAVFLPAGGWTNATTRVVNPTRGAYWSSTNGESAGDSYYENACSFYFYPDNVLIKQQTPKHDGLSVRLVKDVPALP